MRKLAYAAAGLAVAVVAGGGTAVALGGAPDAPLAAAIAKQSFREEDQANMRLLNEAVWASVKGAASKMPSPQHHVIDPAAYAGEG